MAHTIIQGIETEDMGEVVGALDITAVHNGNSYDLVFGESAKGERQMIVSTCHGESILIDLDLIFGKEEEFAA